MLKTRHFWIITVLALVTILMIIIFFPGSHNEYAREASFKQLSAEISIMVNAQPEYSSVQLGDTFNYIIEVLYDSDEVLKIDSVNLDKNVNFEPFEITTASDSDFKVNSEFRIYQKQYTLQLIDGETGFLYEFPTIVVRYQLKGLDGYTETSVVPEPVYVAARLSNHRDAIIDSFKSGDEIYMPLKGEIEDTGYNLPELICLVTGGFLLILVITDFIVRILPMIKEKERKQRELDQNSFINQAYHSINNNIESGADHIKIFHQMDLTLRAILYDKENFDWLEEPDFSVIPDVIRPSVIYVFNKSQEAYNLNASIPNNIEEAWEKFSCIFDYYYSKV